MNTSTAQSIILLSAVVTAAIEWYKAAQQGKLPPAKAVVGWTVAYLVVMALSDFAPQLAGPFALAMLVGALLRNQGILSTINKQAGVAPAKQTAPTPVHVPTGGTVGQIPGL